MLEVRFGFAAFVLLMGCIWTWRGAAYYLAALLLHELGHCMVLWQGHITVRCVRLGFGDVEMETEVLGYGRELVCALAGPLANLALGVGLRHMVPGFAAVNVLLGCYNLLPVTPLDGGRMVAALLRQALPEGTAWRMERVWRWLVVAALLLGVVHIAWQVGAGTWPIAAGLCARLAFAEKNVAFDGRTRYNKKK